VVPYCPRENMRSHKLNAPGGCGGGGLAGGGGLGGDGGELGGAPAIVHIACDRTATVIIRATLELVTLELRDARMSLICEETGRTRTITRACCTMKKPLSECPPCRRVDHLAGAIVNSPSSVE
jgi:hypothetical protein